MQRTVVVPITPPGCLSFKTLGDGGACRKGRMGMSIDTSGCMCDSLFRKGLSVVGCGLRGVCGGGSDRIKKQTNAKQR